MSRAGASSSIGKIIAGLCLFAASGGVYVVSRDHFLIIPAAVALALCGLAVLLSLLSRTWRQRVLLAGGIAFLAGALVVVGAAVLLPPNAGNVVAAYALAPIGAGGLLVIGIAIAYVAEYAWDTAREFALMAPAWTRLVYRGDLPPDAPDAARDHQAAIAQFHRMAPGLAAHVENATRSPTHQKRPVRIPRAPDGPWWQRVLGIAAKGYIATVCALLLAWLISLLLLLPAWLQQLMGGLIGVAPVVGAVLLFPLAVPTFYALAAPVVLLVRDWRPASPLRRWWARGFVTGLYSAGQGLLVAGASLPLFGRSVAWGALLFFSAIAVFLVVVGLMGSMMAALLRLLRGRARVPANIAR